MFDAAAADHHYDDHHRDDLDDHDDDHWYIYICVKQRTYITCSRRFGPPTSLRYLEGCLRLAMARSKVPPFFFSGAHRRLRISRFSRYSNGLTTVVKPRKVSFCSHKATVQNFWNIVPPNFTGHICSYDCFWSIECHSSWEPWLVFHSITG